MSAHSSHLQCFRGPYWERRVRILQIDPHTQAQCCSLRQSSFTNCCNSTYLTHVSHSKAYSEAAWEAWKTNMAGQFTTEQQQAAKQYILSFPRVAGWVKKACQGQGECWRGSCFQWFWVARFASCSPHSLLKDVKHIQRMSVATNENKAQHTAIWLPTGIEINPNTWRWLNTPHRARV